MKDGPKNVLFSISNRIPLLREAADPVIATVLWTLLIATAGAVALPGEIFPHDHDARTHVLQIAGGLLLVLGAYATSIALRDRRATEYLTRLADAIGKLDSSTLPARAGTIRLVQSLALERPTLPSDSTTEGALSARRAAIWDALCMIEGRDPELAALAEQVLGELRASGFERPDGAFEVPRPTRLS
jgi:hypothetical protein